MRGRTLIVGLASLLVATAAVADDAPRIRLDSGHPWRPPFGLDRVGRPLQVLVEFPGAERPAGDLSLVLLRAGKEVGRQPVALPGVPPWRVRVPLETIAEEWILESTPGPGATPVRLASRAIAPPEFEAEAVARPDVVVNPVDLGTVLVPEGWLLLGPEGKGGGSLEYAVVCRSHDENGVRLSVQFQTAPEAARATAIDLKAGRVARGRLPLPATPAEGDRDELVVSLASSGGRELWRKTVPVMIVREPPRLPSFGATRLKLRFDAPISVRDPKTGTFSTLPYEQGWDPKLDDVVVSLPNGARFVFWRGSSDIPFWAGTHNTGLCYEWAENLHQPKDAVDCVEPLMDKELRYGRVEVVESTPARVHVRWRYQSTDLYYKVWGDEAVEDYYFYPDGFGTRVVSLKCDPAADYELSEFILLAPQDAYPFAVMPERPIELLAPDGSKHSIAFPIDREAESRLRREVTPPAIYRVRLHRDDRSTAISFNPGERELPPVIFGAFTDGGEVVTPAYWGSHWPLARGNATGSAIDDRIHVTPSHNSLMSWAKSKPEPIRSATVPTLDAQGRSRVMVVRRWAWLIGMTDAADDAVRAVAASYAAPPSLSAEGARVDFEAYSPERRALRLRVERPDVAIELTPGVGAVVNPVFELEDAPRGPLRLSLDGRPVPEGRWAWDGRVLWLEARLEARSRLQLSFGSTSRPD